MNTFDINTITRENVKSLKPYSSARDEFEDFDTAEMIFWMRMKIRFKME